MEFPPQAQTSASNINLCGVELISEIRVGSIEIQADKGAVEGETDSYVIPSLGESIHFTAVTDTADIPGLIRWSVSDAEDNNGEAGNNSGEKINRAVITQDGVLTALDYGHVLVTASATDGSDKEKTVKVEIAAVHPQSIVLNKLNKILESGGILDLQYRIAPSNAVNQEVDFTSSDPEVASVTEKGRVTAHKAGEADITVTTRDGGLTAVCHVTVSEVKAGLEKLIAQAEALDENDYLAEGFQTLQNVLKDARQTLADKYSRKQDWLAAADALQSAINGLVNCEEVSAQLKELVNMAAAVDFTKYTEESYAPVQAALTHARAVLEAGKNASEEEISDARTKLKAALDGLKEKTPDAGDDGNGGNDGSDDGNNGNGDDGNSGNDDNNGNGGSGNNGNNTQDGNIPDDGSGGTQTADTADRKSPQTGDNSLEDQSYGQPEDFGILSAAAGTAIAADTECLDGILWMVGALVFISAMAAGTAVVYRRKRKNQD